MPVDSNEVANAAILLMGGNQPRVSGQNPTWDDSTNGTALRDLYTQCVASVMRQFEYDFARNVQTLDVTGNAAPLGFSFEYLYPASAIEVWQILEPTIADPNNPLPTTWVVGNTLVESVQRKVIWTNIEDALVVCDNNPTESTWDALFCEAVERKLASELATATAGRPDTAELMLKSGAAFQQVAEQRDS